MTISLIKIVLNAIKNYCKNKDKDCTNCPFRINNSWAEYCVFGGPHVGEGVIPEDWELDEVDFKDDIGDYN